MCASSFVSGEWMQRYPWPQQMQRYPWPQQFTAYQWPTYQDLLEKARKYDELTKQPNCIEPIKDQWVKELERVMKEKFGLVPKGDSQ